MSYIGQRLAKIQSNSKDYDNTTNYQSNCSTKNRYTATVNYSNPPIIDDHENNDVELYLDSNSRSSGDLADTELDMNHHRRYSRHFTLSPETTDYDSNCGDLDSLSNDLNVCIGLNSFSGNAMNGSSIISDYSRLYTSMPVLEDGLSSGHASDTENNNPIPYSTSSTTITTTNVTTSSTQLNNLFDSKHIGNNLNNVSKMLTPTPAISAAINSNSSDLGNSVNLMDVVTAIATNDDGDTTLGKEIE